MSIAKMIDHTMLKADTKEETILRYCKEAKEYGFASICVNTCVVPLVAKELEGSDVKTCCVVGFPLGAMSTAAKAFEAKQAVADGAEEVDMVINIGAMKDERFDFEDTIEVPFDAIDGFTLKEGDEEVATINKTFTIRISDQTASEYEVENS